VANANRINLAGALRSHAVLTDEATELEESISQLHDTGLGPDSTNAHYQPNLGLAHRELYRLTGQPDALNVATAALRAALAVTGADQQLHASIAGDLAQTLLYQQDGSAEALGLLTEAARHPAATAFTRFDATIAAAQLQTPADAMAWWCRAVDLLPILAWRGSRYRDRETTAGRFADTARAAAACACVLARPAQAVSLLETGRAVLWNQLLEARADLQQLWVAKPAVAARMELVRAELDSTDHW
jgi:hypothetical protein